MAYDPSNYINGVDQRTVSEQRRDAQVDANKKKALEASHAKAIAAGAKRAAERDAINKAKLSTPKPSGTQAGHVVTTSKNNTKPVTPAPKTPAKPAMPTKRPAVGADKSAQKKYGSSSWNNGYTN